MLKMVLEHAVNHATSHLTFSKSKTKSVMDKLIKVSNKQAIPVVTCGLCFTSVIGLGPMRGGLAGGTGPPALLSLTDCLL